jgi:hypothetical protein
MTFLAVKPVNQKSSVWFFTSEMLVVRNVISDYTGNIPSQVMALSDYTGSITFPSYQPMTFLTTNNSLAQTKQWFFGLTGLTARNVI